MLFSESSNKVYELSDITIYVRAGIEAIVEDQITSRFEAEKLEVIIFLLASKKVLKDLYSKKFEEIKPNYSPSIKWYGLENLEGKILIQSKIVISSWN